MMKLSEIYNPYDVVVIPFPYTDNIEQSKRRPAVVVSEGLSFNRKTGQLICAMITSSKLLWPLDVAIKHLKAAGLENPCVVRMKLFTLDQRFILRKAGSLHLEDQTALVKALRLVLNL